LVAPDTRDGTLSLLERWLSLTVAERSLMGKSARELYMRRFTVDAMANGLLDVVRQYAAPTDAVRA
jgi:hypothetical protein